MDDRSDYFQRNAERQLHVPKLVRIALGVIVVFGGVLLVLLGALLLREAARGELPHTLPALALMLLTVALGAGFAYVGARLLRMGKDADSLFSPRAARVASYCVAGLGVAMASGGLLLLRLDFFVSGIFTILMARWLYRSMRQGKS